RLGAVAERRGPDPLRRARRAGARGRHIPGHHGTPYAGGSVSASSKDGGSRPAGGRGGARLQQSADRDSRTLRAVADGARSERSAPDRYSEDSQGGRERRGTH